MIERHEYPLVSFAADEHSQNGEDGVIARLFEIIGTTTSLCCEFGAWDGIHFSNTRALIRRGWHGVLIESELARWRELERLYRDRQDVLCVNARIDDASESLDALLDSLSIAKRFDFVSIDIDGLDYYVFRSLRRRPRVICVEVPSVHTPTSLTLTPREIAANGVGQPLAVFNRLAGEKGYRLVGYTANAFFIHDGVGHYSELPTLTPQEAYEQYVEHLTLEARRWLYIANRGLVEPQRRFENPYLTSRALALSRPQVIRALAEGLVWRARRYMGRSAYLRRLLGYPSR